VGVARGIKTGTVWINTYKQFSIATPFRRRERQRDRARKGPQGICAWMAQKSIYYDLSGKPHPWAN